MRSMRFAPLLLLNSAVFAQTGAISGRIADEFDIPVSGASVQAKDAAGKQFKATSTATGEYTIDKLPLGTYEVTFSLTMMKNLVKKDFVVKAESARLDVTLLEAGLGTLGDGDRFSAARYFGIGSTPPSGPVPRLPDGKPDLSGMWFRKNSGGEPPQIPPEAPQPFPWADAIRRERQASNQRDLPDSRCLPSFVSAQGRFVYTPSILVIYSNTGLEPPRQIFLDSRDHPKDPNPTWLGDSIGHWEGDTLVVDTVGFNGLSWVYGGFPATEALHVIERFHRADLGHLEIETVIEDPPVLQKPWKQKSILNLDLKEDVEEYVCENNKDIEHMFGK